MLRKRRGLSAGGGTPDAAARQLWFCIGTITTGIFAADLLQEQQAQSINSRLGCSVTPIGSAVRDLMKSPACRNGGPMRWRIPALLPRSSADSR
jgi:hypothetical protein